MRKAALAAFPAPQAFASHAAVFSSNMPVSEQRLACQPPPAPGAAAYNREGDMGQREKFARPAKRSPPELYSAKALFGGLAVPVIVVMIPFGLGLVLVNDAVAMLGRTVDRVEPERCLAVVDDVMARAGGDDHREIVLDAVVDTIDPDDSAAFLDSEELIAIVMYFFADVAAGRQGHQHQLKVLPGVEDPAEILVRHGHALDIVD